MMKNLMIILLNIDSMSCILGDRTRDAVGFLKMSKIITDSLVLFL